MFLVHHTQVHERINTLKWPHEGTRRYDNSMEDVEEGVDVVVLT